MKTRAVAARVSISPSRPLDLSSRISLSSDHRSLSRLTLSQCPRYNLDGRKEPRMKSLSLVAAAGCAGFLLAACGGDDGGSSGTTATATARPASGEINVTLQEYSI